MMYNIKYSNNAKKDINDIIYYISHELKSKKAALNLIQEINKQEKNILTFPYGASVYKSSLSKKLQYEYRSTLVKNYKILYIIDEDEKIIVIARVLYNKRDIANLLK